MANERTLMKVRRIGSLVAIGHAPLEDGPGGPTAPAPDCDPIEAGCPGTPIPAPSPAA